MEELDDHCLQYIFSIVGEYLNCPARRVCRRFRALIPPPTRAAANNILALAAKMGNIELCTLAHACGASDFDEMLACAAMGGHAQICQLAKTLHEPKGEINICEMVINAAYRGHAHICQLAREWDEAQHEPRYNDNLQKGEGFTTREWNKPDRLESEKRKNVSLPFLVDSMLEEGARGGHENICRLAHSWGANYLTKMLIAAAQYGNVSICWLAREWIIADWEKRDKAAGTQWFNMHTVKCWVKSVVGRILIDGAENGHESICRLARSWGADNLRQMLFVASESGYADICHLARAWNDGLPEGLRREGSDGLPEGLRREGSDGLPEGLRREGSDGSRESRSKERYKEEQRGKSENEVNTKIRNGRPESWIANFLEIDLSPEVEPFNAVDWNSMMARAAFHGQEKICRLARSWGATNWDDMLCFAAGGGQEKICRLAREWGATCWKMMFIRARDAGKFHICQLAIEWDATAFPKAYEGEGATVVSSSI